MATFLILYIYLHPTRLRGTLTPPNHMPLWHTVFQKNKTKKNNLLGNGPLCHILLEQAIKVKNLTNTITLN